MDRRQRKSREAIFNAFTIILSKKEFNKITVGEIIEKADVSRATFYAHFETKDYLLKEYCEELFCHIFDTKDNISNHKHIFSCDSSDSVFLHLLKHIQNNDNNLLLLLTSKNNELFLKYFKENLQILIEKEYNNFENNKNKTLPISLWKNHIASTFCEIIKWWINDGLKESPEQINQYFLVIL